MACPVIGTIASSPKASVTARSPSVGCAALSVEPPVLAIAGGAWLPRSKR